jgi:lipopolysaccharide export system protein LptA
LSGAFLFEALFPYWLGHADDQLPVLEDKNKNRPIHVNADRLISNIEDGWAEFTGNVCVTRESLIINPIISKFITKNYLRIKTNREKAKS